MAYLKVDKNYTIIFKTTKWQALEVKKRRYKNVQFTVFNLFGAFLNKIMPTFIHHFVGNFMAYINYKIVFKTTKLQASESKKRSTYKNFQFIIFNFLGHF